MSKEKQVKKESKWGSQTNKQTMYSVKINKWIKSTLCPRACRGCW